MEDGKQWSRLKEQEQKSSLDNLEEEFPRQRFRENPDGFVPPPLDWAEIKTKMQGELQLQALLLVVASAVLMVAGSLTVHRYPMALTLALEIPGAIAMAVAFSRLGGQRRFDLAVVGTPREVPFGQLIIKARKTISVMDHPEELEWCLQTAAQLLQAETMREYQRQWLSARIEKILFAHQLHGNQSFQ